jgi:mannose-6-phosphate isomerase-like protein (cupin superfamily)
MKASVEYYKRMRKVNSKDVGEEPWWSPKGKFGGLSKEISVALGRKPESMDLNERHPFDVEICRIAPSKINWPYHCHSAQWEFYHVISGTGIVRHQEGMTTIEPGDAFIFKPEEPHQIINSGTEDLVFYIVANNPIGGSCRYPDSQKWAVTSPEERVIRSRGLDFYDGEE